MKVKGAFDLLGFNTSLISTLHQFIIMALKGKQ